MVHVTKNLLRVLILPAAILAAKGAQAQQMPHGPGMMGTTGQGLGQMPMMGYGTGMPMGQGMGQMPMMGYVTGMPTGQGMGQMPMMGYGMPMPMGQGMGQMPMMGNGDINTYADTRATFLKSQLGLTEAQAPVWNAYVSAFRAHLTAKQQHHQAMMASMAAGTTSAQAAEAMVTSMDGCHKAMKDLKNSYVALYQALTPEQKQRADAVFSGMGWMM